MVAPSFAAVPFYSWFCRVTGFGGTTGRRRGRRPAAALDRLVTVSFDANTAPDMPWEFRPKQRSMTLRLGETGLAFFEAYNPTDEPMAGQAGFNVVPFSVGGYFDKIACFCFELQVLGPRRAGRDAGDLLRRPGDARRPRGARRDRHHALLYDVPGRPARGGRCPGAAGDARFAAAPADRGQTIEQ